MHRGRGGAPLHGVVHGVCHCEGSLRGIGVLENALKVGWRHAVRGAGCCTDRRFHSICSSIGALLMGEGVSTGCRTAVSSICRRKLLLGGVANSAHAPLGSLPLSLVDDLVKDIRLGEQTPPNHVQVLLGRTIRASGLRTISGCRTRVPGARSGCRGGLLLCR